MTTTTRREALALTAAALVLPTSAKPAPAKPVSAPQIVNGWVLLGTDAPK